MTEMLMAEMLKINRTLQSKREIYSTQNRWERSEHYTRLTRNKYIYIYIHFLNNVHHKYIIVDGWKCEWEFNLSKIKSLQLQEIHLEKAVGAGCTWGQKWMWCEWKTQRNQQMMYLVGNNVQYECVSIAPGPPLYQIDKGLFCQSGAMAQM